MIKSVIFDMDGVLLDSFEGNYRFINDVVTHFGYLSPTKQQYRDVFHYSMKDIVRTFCQIQSEEKITSIINYGNSIYSSNGYDKLVVLVTGVSQIIPQLAKKYRLGIVTNRSNQGIYVPRLRPLKRYFASEVGFEDTQKHKPDPEPLLYIANKLQIHPSEAVYIGDAESDMQAAKNAGMYSISYSAHNLPLADYSTDKFSEIPRIVECIYR